MTLGLPSPDVAPLASGPDPRLADLVAEFPASVFCPALCVSQAHAERYASLLALAAARQLGLSTLLDRWQSAGDVATAAGLAPTFAPMLAWLLDRLALDKQVATSEDAAGRHYRATAAWPEAAVLDAERTRVRTAALAIDAAVAPTYDLMDTAFAAYPAIAAGETSGREALLGMGNVGLWLAYFDNRHPLYAINNWVAATAAALHLPDRRPLRILEVGAGSGSGSECLLQVLAGLGLLSQIQCYRVTEPSALFRRKAERRLAARYAPLRPEFATLDIDDPWDGQGVTADSFDLVYAVNVFHVARNPGFSLAQAHAALAPGGRLVIGECLRPYPGYPLYIEAVFRLLEDHAHRGGRDEGAFLSWERWQEHLASAGFVEATTAPDHLRIRDIAPGFFVGALCASRAAVAGVSR